MLHAFIANISHAPRLGLPTIANDAGAAAAEGAIQGVTLEK